jgi:IrrE N-terminal-like domain
MTTTTDLLTDQQLADRVVELVAWAREHYDIPEGCTSGDACQVLGLGVRRAKLPKGMDGLLSEKESLIVVSTDVAIGARYEYTVFHEVTHYLIEQTGALIDYFTEALRNDDRHFKAAIERCCQMGAAEFLLPRERVREAIAAHGFSVDLVDRLADDHGVSLLAAATQVATNAPVDCYVAVCAYGVSPRFWPPELTLYVEQASMRPGMRYPWARFAPIPREHLFHQVWETKQRLEGPGYVLFPNSRRKMPCRHAEAKPAGDRVVGIIYVGNPPRRGQLGLDLPSE